MRRTGNYKHGCTAHPLYKIWQYMKSRCCNHNDTAYHRYGARGITVCPEWLDSPSAFVEWGISSGWKEGLYLDRRDNARGYSPDNCRFVSASLSNINQGKRTDNTSGFRGVNYHRRSRRWAARVQVNGKRKWIGDFHTIENAIAARDQYITKHGLPHVLCAGGA